MWIDFNGYRVMAGFDDQISEANGLSLPYMWWLHACEAQYVGGKPACIPTRGGHFLCWRLS
jgi:hypothetical protein